MSQMTVRYFIELASNIGKQAWADALALAEAHKRMDDAVGRTGDKVGGLQRRIGDLTVGSATQRHLDYFDRLGRSIDSVKQRAAGLKQALAVGLDRLPEIGAAATGGYLAGKQIALPPMRAFSDLESASTDLKVALMDSAGRVDVSFGRIAKVAEQLGNKLPGSTKDFMGGARVLVEQGMSGNQVAGGGLQAASNFGVLLGLDPATAARTIAKTREAYGLADGDFGFAADYMQRGRYGFGIDPSDFLAVGSYAAPTYNALGLRGRDNFKRLLAVQGMAAGVGLEASSFGTNFSQMLGRLAEIDPKLGRNSKKSKETAALLSAHGVDMQFYDQRGEFGGIENMLTQLSKLRGLSTMDRQRVTAELFGAEAGRPAMILAEKGLEEYRKAIAKLDAQADLDTRITTKMDTFASKLEALAGTVEGVMARMANPIGQESKGWLDGLNGAAGGVGQFFSDHPNIGTTALVGTTALGALAGGRGLLSAFRTVRGVGSAVQTLSAGAIAANRAVGSALPVAAESAAAKIASQVATVTAGSMASGPKLHSLFNGESPAVAALAARNARVAAARNAIEEARTAARSAAAWAPLERQAAMAARAASVGRFALRAAPWVGLGLESYGVLNDSTLTGAGKARGLGMAAAGFGGAWGGASAGAAVGTMIMPGVGTVLGGLAGGAAGYFGGRGALGSLWAQDPRRDFVQVTAPNGTALGKAGPGQPTTVQIGEGRVTLDVRVTDDRVAVHQTVTQQPSVIKINPGWTNPGGLK
jgi:TP901 family phage tail tape measure protein